ncbi:hydroxymethylglutaryl-CoA synthase [Auritidibacter ignavus]|uniref:hydroxymethylglutaryl-CoA synthase n=1 Tax=Auritidibacter ignavus TaxID=678932 RepID=UPI00244D5EC1|nr:hydroxymethylglutaryl-CoA synthase [Auritidibacter ignavus]WGH90502.1 hydroxymethylglutaryl-CoA synthase [Auritidibacter ignavus]
MTQYSIGLTDLDVATTGYVLSLDDLADYQGTDPAKYHLGLGQDCFSVPGADEDIVTLAATAASRLVARHPEHKITQLYFATETGVDQSKSAGVFVHQLLGLAPNVRTVELKQACYSATAALQLAVGHITRFPQEQVLVIASDIARYALDTPGEPTQGAGAVAMLVSAEPHLVALEPVTGFYTADVNDFWRPTDSSTPYVNGHLSLDAYLDATAGAYDDAMRRAPGLDLEDIDRFLHHQPFTKMARKAHRHLGQHLGVELDDALIEESMSVNRQLGNSYTASLYFALAAQLTNNAELARKRLGFFSYGSGSVAEFFTGVVQPGYTEHLDYLEHLQADLNARKTLSVEQYRQLHHSYRLDSDNYTTPTDTATSFRFAGVTDHVRQYETGLLPS